MGILFSILSKRVMAALGAAIHFPESAQEKFRFWKMDRPDEPGDDGFILGETTESNWVARFCGP
jgi:hypothetical protein